MSKMKYNYLIIYGADFSKKASLKNLEMKISVNLLLLTTQLQII